MTPRIQYGHLLRLAQRRVAVSDTPVRWRPSKSLAVAVQCPRLQFEPFSTSRARWQEPRQAPAPGAADTQTTAPETAEPTRATATPVEPNPSSSPKGEKKRLVPRIIFAVFFTLIGTAAGSSVRLLLSPPNPPEPGSEEDEYTKRVLRDQASKLPIVQRLSADPAWQSWDAYESLSAEHKAQHITAGALAGSRGVGGYQRVFHHAASGELVSVIYFGAATAGWPGVVHGGCLATILDESCGRAAFKQWGGRAGVTASLTLEYKKVTLANGFYVVRVRPRAEEDLPESERGKRHYKCFVDATIEDAVTGNVTVTAEALFVGGEGKKKKNQSAFSWAGKVRDDHARF
ncbi:hypothetical protein MFIFM68171_01796 [Madurella fahalii]|uniref:Thioesterase domain-containing protein n=1 Tax=Madurella fahalii TaxID=1157608 RepID=A0ABQ0G1F2_9PEZI